MDVWRFMLVLFTNQNKMRKDIDYWDIIFHRCEWCKYHQLWDERTLENYMRLTRIINGMDDEWFSRDETAYEDIWW